MNNKLACTRHGHFECIFGPYSRNCYKTHEFVPHLSQPRFKSVSIYQANMLLIFCFVIDILFCFIGLRTKLQKICKLSLFLSIVRAEYLQFDCIKVYCSFQHPIYVSLTFAMSARAVEHTLVLMGPEILLVSHVFVDKTTWKFLLSFQFIIWTTL